MNRIALHATGAALFVFAWSFWPRPVGPTPDAFASAAQSALPEIVINDNREPAGTLTGGVLELELEIVSMRDGPDGETPVLLDFGLARDSGTTSPRPRCSRSPNAERRRPTRVR